MNYYTQQQVQAAQHTDLVSFLASRGETTVRKGHDSLWEKHQVWINGHEWFSHYENVGGYAIDFVQRFYGLNFLDAVRELIGTDASEYIPVPASLPPPKEKKPLVLPERNPTMELVTAYLTGERFVSPEIVSVFADAGILYESADHHDCVFVGMDENGNPRHCHKRSTGGDFKQTMPGSEAEFSFHYNGANDSLFVFEAPIDMLAYITLYPDGWQDHSYVALCSVADRALTHRLKVTPNLRKVFLCLDNDEAGQTAAERMKESLTERGYDIEILRPTNKDWDEDLKAANGVAPIPAGERNQNTHTTESEDYKLNENTENLNANPETTDPIDELMAYAEPMEVPMPSATKTEDDLLAERLRKMYAPDVSVSEESALEVTSETDTPAPVTTEDNSADVSSVSPVSGNDDDEERPKRKKKDSPLPPAQPRDDDNWYAEPYFKSNGALWMIRRTAKGDIDTQIATFAPRVLRETILHGTTEDQKLFVLGGISASGEVLPECEIPAKDLGKMDWVDNSMPSDCLLFVEGQADKHVKNAIKTTASLAEHTDVWCYTGWQKIDGRWEYLIPGYGEQEVRLTDNLKRYALEPDCRDDDLLSFAAFVLSDDIPHAYLLPVLCHAFLSPLNEFMNQAGMQPRYLLTMIGQTGSYKSSLAAVVLSSFGEFAIDSFPMTFRSTANSVPEVGHILKDVLLVIDDYHPLSKKEAEEMKHVLQVAVRAWGDHAGRTRLRPDASINEPKAPRGNVIVTGEFLPDLAPSDFARLFVVEMQKDMIEDMVMRDAQDLAHEGLFRRVMSVYIDWIKDTFLTTEESMAAFVSSLRTQAQDVRSAWRERLHGEGIEFHGRLPDAIASLTIGFRMLTEFLRSKNLLTDADRQKLADELNEVFLTTAKQQAGRMLASDPGYLYLKAVMQMVSEKTLRIDPADGQCHSVTSNLAGFVDDEYYYIRLERTLQEAHRYYDRLNQPLNITADALSKLLMDEKILEPQKGARTKKKRFGQNVTLNVMFLRRDAVDRLLAE